MKVVSDRMWTTLTHQGIKKRLLTVDYHKFIYQQMEKEKFKDTIGERIDIPDNVKRIYFNNLNQLIFEYNFSIDKREYSTTYKKQFYKIILPNLDIKLKYNIQTKTVYDLIMLHKNKRLLLPNFYDKGEACLGSVNTKIEKSTLKDIKKWVVKFLCSDWNDDLFHPEFSSFKTAKEMFDWLEKPRKSYAKILKEVRK